VLTSDQARALIGVMTYAFARIGAVVAMRVEDYFANGKRWWIRLHEKGGKRHEMPAHHKLEAFLDEYIKAAGIGDEGKSPLFRSAFGRSGLLNGEAMHRIDAYRMIQRRVSTLGLKVKFGCHTFRATGR
jgi:integrase